MWMLPPIARREHWHDHEHYCDCGARLRCACDLDRCTIGKHWTCDNCHD